ncbi:MAG: twin-arginine translocase TatA/TatE family subunit [Polyangiales bacterium]
MFGMGGTEILVILIVALLFLGPDKLPQAAKQISKGIRDLKRQSRSLQQQIEGDEQIGGALRDIKSALRGEDAPVTPKKLKPKKPKKLPAGEENSINPPAAETSGEPAPELEPAVIAAAEAPAAEVTDDAPEAPAVRLPPEAGERDADSPPPSEDDDEALASLIKPAAGTVAKGSEPTHG